jgi:dTDP-4-amino-4,6-dideoxygalactose transaminase
MRHPAEAIAGAAERFPWRDLAAQDRSLRAEIREAVDGVLASGRYIGGPEVEALEAELATSLDVRHVITVNSGTDALVLILRAAGIGPGDEVIVPSYTFVASATTVAWVGARPVFADSLADEFCVDPASVEAAMTPRTRAVVAVHLFGRPADMDALSALCRRHRVALIEDAAQAFGGRHGGRPLGSIGTAGAFSFYPTKNLACAGDGGAVATNDAELAATIRSLRQHGLGNAETAERLGTNSRLDAVQAAVLRIKLPHVEGWNAARRRLAETYRAGLAGTRARAPGAPLDGDHVYHQFVIGHPSRDSLRAYLARHGIPSMVYYETPCHRQPVFQPQAALAFPHAEAWSRTALALPIYPELSLESVHAVCAAIRDFDR